jgi:hypothetical protein
MVIFTTSRGWLKAESTTYGMLLALATRGIHNLAIYRNAKLPGLQVLAQHGDYTMCEQTYRLKTSIVGRIAGGSGCLSCTYGILQRVERIAHVSYREKGGNKLPDGGPRKVRGNGDLVIVQALPGIRPSPLCNATVRHSPANGYMSPINSR